MNKSNVRVTAPERIVSLGYRVHRERRDDLLQFLARAIPFYERPGDIQVTLYESLDNPGLYLELVAYGNVDTYEADQQRVENSSEYRAVLEEWHDLIDGKLDIGRLERIDLSSIPTEAGSDLVLPSGLLIEAAAFNDYAEIAKLLTENNLPVPSTDDRPVRFITALQTEQIVACLGWESYGFRVFLRSLAVRHDLQRQGIGSLLVREALSRLAADGVSEFYLLTSSAVDFALRLGFKPIDRCSLPVAVKTSQQVSSGCCSTAQCMRLQVNATTLLTEEGTMCLS